MGRRKIIGLIQEGLTWNADNPDITDWRRFVLSAFHFPLQLVNLKKML